MLRRANRTAQSLRDWRGFLDYTFPFLHLREFAQHHVEFWQWCEKIERGTRPRPFVAIWSRGGAKSSSAELATVFVGMTERRRYAIYVCETQEQADKHVASIATLLERAGVERAVNKYGASRGWRRERLRCAGGYTIDALGLDTATRGIKTDEARPDFIILDDIDGRHDSAAATEKNIQTLTTSVLPAASNDCAVVAIQNVVHPNSVFARLADGRAEFLQDRIVSGPHPALTGFAYEARDGKWRVTAGTPTWIGQDVVACEGLLNTIGVEAFLRECQHEFSVSTDSVYGDVWIDAPDTDDTNVTERAEYRPDGGELLWAIDDGYAGEFDSKAGYFTAESHPRVILFCQQRPDGILCVFDESYAVKVLTDVHLDQALAKYPAPSRVGLGKEMAELRGRLHARGIYTLAGASSVDESVKVLRSWIGRDANGVRRVLVHPRCKILRKEPHLFTHIEGTAWKDTFGHGLAALRYLVWGLRHVQ